MFKDKEVHCQFVPIWNSTLHHIDDLPNDPNEKFPFKFMAMVSALSGVKIRALLPSPKKGQLPLISKYNEHIKKALTFLPDLKQHFKFSDEEIKETCVHNKYSCHKVIGGESIGLQRLEKYIKSKDIKNYEETRNDLIGSDYSFKLTPWIANGSLSIKKVYKAV